MFFFSLIHTPLSRNVHKLVANINKLYDIAHEYRKSRASIGKRDTAVLTSGLPATPVSPVMVQDLLSHRCSYYSDGNRRLSAIQIS